MSSEAVSGRYGAARHAVTDGGGAQRPSAPDDRSLVDRLLADNGDDHGFDWGWGDPAAGELVTDREPLHDIPELWGPEERAARPDDEGGRFPTPRLHRESPLDDGPTGDRASYDLDHRTTGRDLDAGRPDPDRPDFSRARFDGPAGERGSDDVDRGERTPDAPGAGFGARDDRDLNPGDRRFADRGAGEPPRPTPVEDDRHWSDRRFDNPGSDDFGAPGPGIEHRRSDDHARSGFADSGFGRTFGESADADRAFGPLDPGTDRAVDEGGFGGPGFGRPGFDGPGSVDRGLGDRRVEDGGIDDRRFDDRRFEGGALDGDPLDALATARVRIEPGTPGGGTPDHDPLHDVRMDGDQVGDRSGPDALDRDPEDRDRSDSAPLGPPPFDRPRLSGDRFVEDRPAPEAIGRLGSEQAEDLDRAGYGLRDGEQLPYDRVGREPAEDLGRAGYGPGDGEQSPYDRVGREPAEDLGRAGYGPRDGEGPPHDGLGREPLGHDWRDRDRLEPPAAGGPSSGEPAERAPSDGDRFGNAFPDGRPRDRDRYSPERDPQDRGGNDRDEPGERKLVAADPRLRRWADRNRPSGPPPDRSDRPAGPGPFPEAQAPADSSGVDQSGAEALDTDQPGADRVGADALASGPDDHDRPGADPFADPSLTESALTGRIRIPEADGRGPERHRPEPLTGGPAGRDVFEQGPLSGGDPFDAVPDPTTALGVVGPAGPARRGPAEEPAPPLQEFAARRRAAEQAAAAAEEAASSAAERASAAIAAAARAAEEAEAAAEIAARAAEQAHEAAEAEARAVADSVARGEATVQQDGRDEPEPPTQAVPMVAPAAAPPGRRPPPRRPAGPLPRDARPDEPGPPAGPPPGAGHRSGPPRDGSARDGSGRDGSARDGADGEATAVLLGLDALRDLDRSRRRESAPAEVTTVTRRRPAAEPVPVRDADADDAEDDEEPEETSLLRRLTTRPVIAAVGVGVVLAVAAIVAFVTTAQSEPAPAEATPAALSEPAALQPPQPTAAAADPHSPKAVAFLTALRDADIPTSSSGQAETEAAAAICAQLDQGADEAQLARSVPAVLPDVTRGQAGDVVDLSQQHYC